MANNVCLSSKFSCIIDSILDLCTAVNFHYNSETDMIVIINNKSENLRERERVEDVCAKCKKTFYLSWAES